MILKPGDKVKFLDATGGGIVRKVIDSRMVLVEVEGGFEIPTLAVKLLKMESAEPGQKYFNETYDIKSGEETEASEIVSDDMVLPLSKEATRTRKAEEVFLAFVPHDQKWFITGLMDVFLINNTSYDLLYNHFRKDEKSGYSGVDYGSVSADSRLLLATVDRDLLPQWETGCLQFLFHKDQCATLPPPVNAEFEIQGKKFYTEGSYRDSKLTDGKSIVVRMVSLDKPLPKKEEPKKEDQAEKKGFDDYILRHQTADREAEVDLHMAALAETGGKFEEGNILEYQKRYFEKVLGSAIRNKFRKVTFIHGVGEGILRDAVKEILKDYSGIEVYDAPVHKFGAGALEVHIPYNYHRHESEK